MGTDITSVESRRRTASRANARRPRPTALKLTRPLIPVICEAIRAGVRPEVAAIMNGVARRTWYDWIEYGREPHAEGLRRELFDAVEVALAQWEAADVLLIGQAARQENAGEWTAAAWRLERRLGSIYGRKLSVKQEITHEVILKSDAWQELADRLLTVLGRYPDALEAVTRELMPGDVVDAEAVDLHP